MRITVAQQINIYVLLNRNVLIKKLKSQMEKQLHSIHRKASGQPLFPSKNLLRVEFVLDHPGCLMQKKLGIYPLAAALPFYWSDFFGLRIWRVKEECSKISEEK